MWQRLANTALGVWLMAAPAVLGYDRPLATSDWIAGPLIASFAVMALWDVLRPLRWPNVPLGLWVAAAPWILGAPLPAKLNGTVVGLLVAALAATGGAVTSELGGGWREAWPLKRRSRA
jgi:hypothetical protein